MTKVARALIVLFDERDNEIFRRHEPVHRQVKPGEIFTIHITFGADEPTDGD